MRIPAVLLLCALAVACTEAPTGPKVGLPSLLTTSTETVLDFEGSGLGCFPDLTTEFPPLSFPEGQNWYAFQAGCGERSVPRTGTTALYNSDANVEATIPPFFDLAAPVQAVRFYMSTVEELTVRALDAQGNTISTATVPPWMVGAGKPAPTSDAYTQVRLNGPGNVITRVVVEGVFFGAYTIDDMTLTTVAEPTPVFTGFFHPVDNNGVLNLVKAGSAVPVKFSMGGDFGLGVLVSPPKAVAITCPTGAGADAVEETTTSPSGLTYNAASDQYNYVWKTQPAWKGTCKRLDLPMSDGVTHAAVFQFK